MDANQENETRKIPKRPSDDNAPCDQLKCRDFLLIFDSTSSRTRKAFSNVCLLNFQKNNVVDYVGTSYVRYRTYRYVGTVMERKVQKLYHRVPGTGTVGYSTTGTVGMVSTVP